MTSLNNDATRKSWSKYIDVSERCTKNNKHVQESNKKGTTTTVVEDADIEIEIVIVITTMTSTTSSTTMAEDEKNGEHDQFIQVAAAAVIKSDKDFHSSSGKEAGENQPLPSKNSNNKIEQEQIETLKNNDDDDFRRQKCHSNRSKNNIDINNDKNNKNHKQQVKVQIKNIKSELQSILHHTAMLLLRELIPMVCQERYYLQCSSNSKTAATTAATATRTSSSATRRCTMNTPPKFQPIVDFISHHSTNQQQNKTISLSIKTTTTTIATQKIIQMCSKLRPPRQFLKLSLLRKKISSSTRSSSSISSNANNEVIRVVTEEEDKRDEEEVYRRFNHITKTICRRILDKNNRIIMKLSRRRRQQQQQQDEENNSNRTTTSSSSTAHNQQHFNQNNKNTEKWYCRDSRRLVSATDTKSTTQSAYCSMEMTSFDKENECFHRKEIAYPYQPPSSSLSSYQKCYDSDNANDRQHGYRCLAKTLEVRVTEANNICKYSLIWQ